MSCKSYFDGSCYLNDCGIGYVIRNSDGSPIYKSAEYAGRGDALRAEFLALMALLQRLALLNIDNAVIHGDCRTVVCQVNGLMGFRRTNRHRKAILRSRRYLKDHPGWRLKWVPRAENGLADALATEGLSSARTGIIGANQRQGVIYPTQFECHFP